MRLARRLSAIEESATLRVSRRAGELRRAGRRIIDFGAGEPDFDSPEVAVEAARKALADGFTRYTAAAGIPELREALAERYRREHGAPWGLSQVLVTVGAKAALFELALALFDEQHEVIIPCPCWVSFPDQVTIAGARSVTVPTDKERGFKVRADAVVGAMTPSTRAVILNSPCNPTGGTLAAEDLERIVAEADRRGVYVIADETYERFVYDGEAVSAAALASRFPETVIVVASFSKTYAMTGWRIGYTLGPADVIAAAGNVQGHATSNPTSFAMRGALAALQGAEADVVRMLAEYRQRRDLLGRLLADVPGFRCQPPAGAFYAFPDVSQLYGLENGFEGSVDLAEYLLEEAGVAVVPGLAFGDDAHVRISFACSRADLEEGVAGMAAAISRRLG